MTRLYRPVLSGPDSAQTDHRFLRGEADSLIQHESNVYVIHSLTIIG